MKAKNIYSKALLGLSAIILLFSCVDDFEDANPARQLDAPFLKLTASDESAVGGDVVDFTVSVIDAPGVISDVEVSTTNDLGTVVINKSSIVGKEKGSFTVSVTMPFNYSGDFEVTIKAIDSQKDTETGEVSPKSTSVSAVVELDYKFAEPDFVVALADADGLLYSGESTDFTITVNSVPSGGVASISIVGVGGVVDFDQADIDALIGKSTGVITGTFTAGGNTTDGGVSVFIKDELQEVITNKVADIDVVCPAEIDMAGTYRAISHGVTRTGVEYHALEATVTLTKTNDGQYALDDNSFGEYPQIRGVAKSAGSLNICGSTVTPISGAFFQHKGTATIDGADVTIDIEWVNSAGDQGVTRLIRQ
ncbi:hypothetical protein C900_05638 [Fulvivirga imtechensis AK7]|uniref:Uncharacterized protein n=1 Tax=Fulvivirga imtechensis AK7 TaxID=1237149 RepID=L8JJG9_9BACT|nr:hypothetical protein [Fulvivirga imtechensis]ELR68945.1 hypothetical protein C900_05638 [Fulvivirga imtechensis AK7]